MNAEDAHHRVNHFHHVAISIGRRIIECLGHTFYTASYLLCELLCFAAFLSVSIGCGALAANLKKYIWREEMSLFVQSYISLWVLHNLSYFQARHQLIYIYPLRARFGNQAYFFFKCNYPASISFCILFLAYVNLFYQFSKLLCSSSNLPPSAPLLSGQGQGQGQTRMSKNDSSGLSTSSFGVTTAFFLLSLSTIQYLTARKLRWDFYSEISRMDPRVFRSCMIYMYAIISLSIVQFVLTIMYSIPMLIWLMFAKFLHWDFTLTVFTTVGWSIVIGYVSSLFERREPFPTMETSRPYHIANLHARCYLMCGVFIPCIALWYFRIQDLICITPYSPAKAVKDTKELDLFNLFILNVCACILNVVKYAALTNHSLAHRIDPFRRQHENPPGPDNQPNLPPIVMQPPIIIEQRNENGTLNENQTNNNNKDDVEKLPSLNQIVPTSPIPPKLLLLTNTTNPVMDISNVHVEAGSSNMTMIKASNLLDPIKLMDVHLNDTNVNQIVHERNFQEVRVTQINHQSQEFSEGMKVEVNTSHPNYFKSQIKNEELTVQCPPSQTPLDDLANNQSIEQRDLLATQKPLNTFPCLNNKQNFNSDQMPMKSKSQLDDPDKTINSNDNHNE